MSHRKRIALAALALLALASALTLTAPGQGLILRLALELGPKSTRAWVLEQSRDQGDQARPILQIAITDPDPDLRWKALDRLLALGPVAAPDTPQLLAATTAPLLWERSSRDFGILICDPSPHGPPFAPDTIANMIPLTIGPRAIPHLLSALENTPDQRQRWLLVYTLRLFENKLPPAAASRLARALDDAHFPTRYHATEALLAIKAHRLIPIAQIKQDLESDDPWRPGLALRVLEGQKRTPRSLVPALISIAEGKNIHLEPRLAIPALSRTGTENQGAVFPCLIRCRNQTDDPELARIATRALRTLGLMRTGDPSDG